MVIKQLNGCDPVVQCGHFVGVYDCVRDVVLRLCIWPVVVDARGNMWTLASYEEHHGASRE